jgi:hypothetical protein
LCRSRRWPNFRLTSPPALAWEQLLVATDEEDGRLVEARPLPGAEDRDDADALGASALDLRVGLLQGEERGRASRSDGVEGRHAAARVGGAMRRSGLLLTAGHHPGFAVVVFYS